MGTRPRHARRWLLGGGLILLFLALPATTKKAVDYQVSEQRVPLGVKGAQFILRDLKYRRLASEWSRGASTPAERAARLFERTRQEIRHTPVGAPVIDDHILNIIARGYGEEDQRADVFTTLAAYAGLPAFWRPVRPSPDEPGRIFSFVRIDNRWTVWDTGAGTGPEELEAHPEIPRPFAVPDFPRAYRQMPVPRAFAEARAACRRVARLGAR